jgi:hypothetical protein
MHPRSASGSARTAWPHSAPASPKCWPYCSSGQQKGHRHPTFQRGAGSRPESGGVVDPRRRVALAAGDDRRRLYSDRELHAPPHRLPRPAQRSLGRASRGRDLRRALCSRRSSRGDEAGRPLVPRPLGGQAEPHWAGEARLWRSRGHESRRIGVAHDEPEQSPRGDASRRGRSHPHRDRRSIVPPGVGDG